MNRDGSSKKRLARPGPRRARRAARRRDATGTREALLEAGTALFAEHGYDGVPLWAIAKQAGVNKAMVNYHFGGKRKLYVAIVTGTFRDIVASVERLADSASPAPDLLRELIAMVGDMVTRRHPHFCTMMLREVLVGGRHLEAAAVEMPVRLLAAVQRIVTRGVREGVLRPVDPVLTHLSIVGSLVFFFATTRFRERVLADRRLGITPPEADAYVRHVQDLITRGLAAESLPPGPRV